VSDAVNPATPFVFPVAFAYFGGNDAAGAPVGRPGRWRTDGTPAGTYRVDGAPAPSELADVGGTLHFNGNAPGTGAEHWKSDGTPTGTSIVKDIAPGSQSSYPMLPRPLATS
jgi:ELWxxDGT repeat protein